MTASAALCRPERGFTLIELVVTVALLGIVLGLAAPSMRSFVVGQRIRALSYDLTSDLLLARSEALKRNANVVVARDAEQWHGGWTTAAGALQLSRRNAMGNNVVFDGAPASITFDANGRVASPNAQVRITLSSSAADAQSRRCVELDLSGRARSLLGACT
ncbi:MAG TPA: GspH/FimT family pseudopilin [Caldimonas sp.]|nr:GspH/FimT family pseudopilin [Caldimonas sp.]HEX2539946.1 GspH/FimT family pseudopilin [Caldimonas sp.]